ncbi:hypothetical protein RHMOL_Rhmol13G0286900 [Rhododendron molle]|uniref:Uncharacterized protein n=1 Tax=Rhododendron molle TaxID=49168 RepID=A0ACC0LDD3_RHOML|nr:hypothetical protein RHMOL_Rhmol13G0286900 [Rhododendron molle]
MTQSNSCPTGATGIPRSSKLRRMLGKHPNPIIKLIPPPPYPPSPLFQKNNSAETQPKTVRVCPSPSSSALLRNLKSQPQILEDSVSATPESSAKLDSVNGSSKVWGNEDGVLDLRGHGLWSLPVEEFGACFACTFQVIQLKREIYSS